VEAADPEDDKLENAMGKDFVKAFHFGGGGEAGGAGADGGDAQAAGGAAARKSKREVMAEVVARSKLAKAEKRQQKEDDEQLLESLDDRFGRLQEVRLELCCWRVVVDDGSPRRRAAGLFVGTDFNR
jgi:nucleolar protein 14